MVPGSVAALSPIDTIGFVTSDITRPVVAPAPPTIAPVVFAPPTIMLEAESTT